MTCARMNPDGFSTRSSRLGHRVFKIYHIRLGSSAATNPMLKTHTDFIEARAVSPRGAESGHIHVIAEKE